MATYTANYQLHQWVPEDNFLRTDFNQDFARIDAGIRAAKAQAEELESSKCEITCGTYVGDGAASRTITLGFQPKAVHLEIRSALRGGSSYNMYGGLAVQEGGVAHNNTALSITAAGFQVFYQGEALANISGESYRYIAFT